MTKKPAFSREIQNLIAQFRGLPKDKSRSIPRESKPIESLLDLCVKKYKIGQIRPEDTIMAHWKTIIGPENAHRCCPKKISRNILIISTTNPVIRNELQFKQPQILKNLQTLPGCQNITGITFIIG